VCLRKWGAAQLLRKLVGGIILIGSRALNGGQQALRVKLIDVEEGGIWIESQQLRNAKSLKPNTNSGTDFGITVTWLGYTMPNTPKAAMTSQTLVSLE